MGITPIMEWMSEAYQKHYAPNSRETVRRFSMHQFVEAGIATYNPDNPERPVNSPKAVYQIENETLDLLRSYNTVSWSENLKKFLKNRKSLIQKYAKKRAQKLIPIQIAPNRTIRLSPGSHSQLIRDVIKEFGPRFAPGSKLVYVGDTGDKWSYFTKDLLEKLSIQVDTHGKMPDVLLYYAQKNWLLLVEAVTSHGPVDSKRHSELSELFKNSTAGLVFVTAFSNRMSMTRYINDIAWETEVWVSDAPSHLIHFNGERFLGPYRP